MSAPQDPLREALAASTERHACLESGYHSPDVMAPRLAAALRALSVTTSLRMRLGPFPNELDAVRSLHQRQDVATPDDHVDTMCRTCYILDEGWPCTVARLIEVLDAQIADEERALPKGHPDTWPGGTMHMGAPRENGWKELRREIEALPDFYGIDRAAVLAIVDRLAAARGAESGWDQMAFYPLLTWAETVSQHHAMLRTEPPWTSTQALKEALASAHAALAATRGEPGLDVERLARALHAEREAFFGYTAPCGDNLCGCRLTAPTVAAEYARIALATPTPEPDQ